jgi:hypothetical protein
MDSANVKMLVSHARWGGTGMRSTKKMIRADIDIWKYHRHDNHSSFQYGRRMGYSGVCFPVQFSFPIRFCFGLVI